MTGVQLQMEYLELARKYTEDKFGSDVDEMTADVLARWESVLTRLAEDPMQLSRELDWVAKLELLEGYRTRDGLAWGHPRLQLVDLQYSDVRPDRGLYNRLVARGRMVQPRLGGGRDPGHRLPAGRHPGLLPRPLPAAVPGVGGRRLLGFGDLRHTRAGNRCSGCRPWSRSAGPRRTWAACWTGAGPRPSWSPR